MTAGVCKHAKTCPTRDAHEHVYVGGEWSRQCSWHYNMFLSLNVNMFSVKDSVPQGLRSRVVYKFSCAGCNASYIGETTRHLRTRAREHLLSDKSSHV